MDVPPSSIKLENAAIKSEPLDTSSIKLEPGAIKNEPVDSMTPIKTEPGSVKADPGVKQEMDIKPTVSSNSRCVMVCCRYLLCHYFHNITIIHFFNCVSFDVFAVRKYQHQQLRHLPLELQTLLLHRNLWGQIKLHLLKSNLNKR